MRVSQEKIVLVLWLALFSVCAIALDGFFQYGNLLSLLRSVAVLGMLAIGMSVVVIGRGIDLSMIATMAVSVALSFGAISSGYSLPVAVLFGLGFALACGLLTGFLIAYIEIPALFATLAMAAIIYGVGRYLIFSQDIVLMPPEAAPLVWIGSGKVLGLPVQVIGLVLLAIAVGFGLTHARFGRFIYAMGDNPVAARTTGIPVRRLVLVQYGGAAVIAFIAGLVMALGVSTMNTRIVSSMLLYDVILVVVLGGISLSGGKGGVRNVLVGTLLIGTLLNVMTILDLQYSIQNLMKSLILLVAIIMDSALNPRDEQTAQQGDI